MCYHLSVILLCKDHSKGLMEDIDPLERNKCDNHKHICDMHKYGIFMAYRKFQSSIISEMDTGC